VGFALPKPTINARCPWREIMKTKLVAHVANETRASCWTLIQHDDGTLHVEQKAEYAEGEKRQRSVSINDFLKESGPPVRCLQTLIDRMFSDG